MTNPSPETKYASLPPGNWKTPDELGLKKEECLQTQGEQSCVTNATSRFPVIGTVGVAGCTAVILYDRVNKTAAIGHYNQWTQKNMDDLIGLFPENVKLEAHVVGGHYFGGDSFSNTSNKRIILGTLQENPRFKIQTVDLYPKPRPRDVGIDTRTGQLIRGSEIYPDEPEFIRGTHIGLMLGHWSYPEKHKPRPPVESSLVFDGRMPEHQLNPNIGIRDIEGLSR